VSEKHASSLKSTYILLDKAFPNGIDERHYFSLLKVLYEHLSDRNLAEVISKVSGKAESIVLNDIYKVAANIVTCEEVPTVIEMLNFCGFSKWIEEE
jgi:transposase